MNSDVAVIALLKVTPNLESLVIEKKEPFRGIGHVYEKKDDDNEDDGLTLDMLDTGCLFLHLKISLLYAYYLGPKGD